MIRESSLVFVEDSVDSPPFSVVGDLVLVIRTPRSNESVTVEIGTLVDNPIGHLKGPARQVVCCPTPAPWISSAWCGEVRCGDDHGVSFEVSGCRYHLTLKCIDSTRFAAPWASYGFLLERRGDSVTGRPADH